MSVGDTEYALEPTTFHSMQEAQELADILEENLQEIRMGAANVRPELVELFSELVNNAAEHGMTEAGASAHVRYLPHRRGRAFDVVVADSGVGIRATLAGNPALTPPETDAAAIGLAVQELVSGSGIPTRGIGLWMTVTEMRKPGRKLWIQSGSGLLTRYGAAEPELREIEPRQGTMVRLTIPA
jgi:anti-sigma regulatory factor (Ser/Thr protein kinase)